MSLIGKVSIPKKKKASSGKTKAQEAAKKRIAKKKSDDRKKAISKKLKAGLKDVGHAALGTTALRAGAKLRKQLKARKKK